MAMPSAHRHCSCELLYELGLAQASNIPCAESGPPAGEYIVLKIDETRLNGEAKYEAAAPAGDKQTTQFSGADSAGTVEVFPHLYSTIDFEAVADESPVGRVSDGTFVSVDGIATITDGLECRLFQLMRQCCTQCGSLYSASHACASRLPCESLAQRAIEPLGPAEQLQRCSHATAHVSHSRTTPARRVVPRAR
jgi:Protein of unknown function (DUF952)